MRILALSPYHGGSHKAFFKGWTDRSSHHWALLSLPAHKWKWRMRHSSVTFAESVAERVEKHEQSWQLVFCTDMLSLAEFVGLAPEPVRCLPRVVYFHENQLTYPSRTEDKRDLHFAFTNLSTALTADEVWFNSRYHLDSFVKALNELLERMPDHAPSGAVATIQRHARIMPPGIDPFPERGSRRDGPLRILWAARWEHDKQPDVFFDALYELHKKGIDFRLSVVGQQFETVPPVFEEAKEMLSSHIDHWGWQATREDYRAVLSQADVAVSTAAHEFFGISMVEAAAAGAYPLLPQRLAYPEVFGLRDDPLNKQFFYNGSVDALVFRLTELSQRIATNGTVWKTSPKKLLARMQQYAWSELAPKYDKALRDLVTERKTDGSL